LRLVSIISTLFRLLQLKKRHFINKVHYKIEDLNAFMHTRHKTHAEVPVRVIIINTYVLIRSSKNYCKAFIFTLSSLVMTYHVLALGSLKTLEDCSQYYDYQCKKNCTNRRHEESLQSIHLAICIYHMYSQIS